MIHKYLLTALIFSSTIISGCATSQGGGQPLTEQALCFLAMAAAGTGAGVAVDDDEPLVFGAGMLLGAAVGYYMCQDEAEAVVAAAPPADTDGDGVIDANDRCPRTPRGTRVNASGCALDSDGDGITDNNDRCPNTPRGAAVNSTGCELDGDSDGVVNRMDNCPDTPRGQAVNEVGCHVIFTLQGVNFAHDSNVLTAAARTKLNEAVTMLKANANINVRVEGHTDSDGTEAYNMQLSERRAQAVVDYMAANGINRNRMSAVGRGEGSPVTGNGTREGRAQNRRVEFIIRN